MFYHADSLVDVVVRLGSLIGNILIKDLIDVRISGLKLPSSCKMIHKNIWIWRERERERERERKRERERALAGLHVHVQGSWEKSVLLHLY